MPLHKQQFIDLLAAYDQSRTWFRRLFATDPEVIDNFRSFVIALADTETPIANDQLFPLISLLDAGLRDESFEPTAPTELFEGLILKAEADSTQELFEGLFQLIHDQLDPKLTQAKVQRMAYIHSILLKLGPEPAQPDPRHSYEFRSIMTQDRDINLSFLLRLLDESNKLDLTKAPGRRKLIIDDAYELSKILHYLNRYNLLSDAVVNELFRKVSEHSQYSRGLYNCLEILESKETLNQTQCSTILSLSTDSSISLINMVGLFSDRLPDLLNGNNLNLLLEYPNHLQQIKYVTDYCPPDVLTQNNFELLLRHSRDLQDNPILGQVLYYLNELSYLSSENFPQILANAHHADGLLNAGLSLLSEPRHRGFRRNGFSFPIPSAYWDRLIQNAPKAADLALAQTILRANNCLTQTTALNLINQIEHIENLVRLFSVLNNAHRLNETTVGAAIRYSTVFNPEILDLLSAIPANLFTETLFTNLIRIIEANPERQIEALHNHLTNFLKENGIRASGKNEDRCNTLQTTLEALEAQNPAQDAEKKRLLRDLGSFRDEYQCLISYTIIDNPVQLNSNEKIDKASWISYLNGTITPTGYPSTRLPITAEDLSIAQLQINTGLQTEIRTQLTQLEAAVTQLSESIKATQSAGHATDASGSTADDQSSSPPRPSR